MRRRAFLSGLTALTAGVSGCTLFGDGDDGVGTVTPYDVPTDGRTPMAGPTEGTPSSPRSGTTVRPGRWQPATGPPILANLETGPRTLALSPLRFDASDGLRFVVRIRATATPEHPARIQALLYNRNDFEKTVRRDRFPLFSRTVPSGAYAEPVTRPESADLARGRLFLVPTQAHSLDDGIEDALVRGPTGYWHADLHPSDYPYGGTVTVPAKAGVVGEYAVCAGRGDGPLVPGTYTFRGPEVFQRQPSAIRPVTVTVWHTEKPGPTATSRFDASFEPALDHEQPVVWFHRADRSTARYLLPEHEAVELPADLSVHLVNRTDEWYRGRLTLLKRRGDRWYDIGPTAGVRFVDQSAEAGIVEEPPDPDGGVGDDGIVRYDLSLSHGASESRPLDIGFLGGGTYGLVTTVEATDSDYGALLDVEAPELRALPEPGVTVTREGETVTVTDAVVDGADDAAATYVATQVDADADRALIDEQVMGRFGPAARNTLSPLRPGVSTVRYHSSDRSPGYEFAQLDGAVVRFHSVTVRVRVPSGGPSLG